jgi:hypothetical protein
MEPMDSVTFSQEPATGPYAEHLSTRHTYVLRAF